MVLIPTVVETTGRGFRSGFRDIREGTDSGDDGEE